MALTDPDRLFPVEPRLRDIARALFDTVEKLPIISPHGHCDPRWFAENRRFPNPAELLVIPDHYLVRMLVSQGVTHAQLGIPRHDGGACETDPRAVWRLFASHYHLFRGTPSAMWLDHSFEHLFGIDDILSADTADSHYDHIDDCLGRDGFRPRALFEQFNVEVLATTDAATDELAWHSQLRDSGWDGHVITTYRPDATIDPEFEGFAANLARLGELTGEDTSSWTGYLAAHRARRAFFKSFGATATDHGHPSCTNGEPATGRGRGTVLENHRRGPRCRGRGSLPGPDADGNGADEP